jgi:hypothetical protein
MEAKLERVSLGDTTRAGDAIGEAKTQNIKKTQK